ncbi:MAG: hypothetical protein ACE10O_04725, partial [Candidatus Acidiferrales bacterium]
GIVRGGVKTDTLRLDGRYVLETRKDGEPVVLKHLLGTVSRPAARRRHCPLGVGRGAKLAGGLQLRPSDISPNPGG